MNLQVRLFFILLDACFPIAVVLIRFDRQLANTEEFQDGVSNGALGEVFIRYAMHDRYNFRPYADLFLACRCNNVLYIISLSVFVAFFGS